MMWSNLAHVHVLVYQIVFLHIHLKVVFHVPLAKEEAFAICY